MKHPAKYTEALIPVFQELVPVDRYPLVLDPFAGTGRVHRLENFTWGIELEPEWAEMHPLTAVGDATALPFFTGDFCAIVTSPCYGNRMADHHEAKDPCRPCGGQGNLGAAHLVCPACLGRGLSRRNTYKWVLGREPSVGSAAVLQWGRPYRALHEAAWREAWRVLRPGGRIVVNVKDHIRKWKVQPVSYWHWQTLVQIGFVPHRQVWVPTPGQRDGANGNLRVEGEWVFALDKP